MLKVWPIALLMLSNVFMTFAWYAHLKHHRHSALWIVILASWGIAFFEYVLGEITIGRLDNNNLVLPKTNVSKQHAHLSHSATHACSQVGRP